MSNTALRSPERKNRIAPRRRHYARLPTIVATLVVIVPTVYFLFPVLWQIVTATKTTPELASTPGLVPSIPPNLWDNLKQLFTTDGAIFGRWFLNSLIYSGVGGVLGTLIAGTSGYVLAHLRFFGKRIVVVAVLIGTLLPATVLAYPTYLVTVQLGIADTYWAFLLPSLINPLTIFLALVFAKQSVPGEVIEAARIDGAGEVRIGLGIGLRLMRTGLVTILIIQVIAIWNNFFLPLMVLSSPSKFPSTLGLYVWNSRVTQSPEYTVLVLVGALVTTIPLIVLFLALQKYWKAGLSSGSVKG